MFKFLKEMADAVREGAAEAREEAAAEEQLKAQADAAGAADAVRRLATTSQPERLLAALAAPYRETFLNELSAAADGKRPAIFLLGASLPDAEIASWKSLLSRDFDLEDGDDARATAMALVDGLTPASDRGEVAVAVVRAAHILAGAAGVGYLGTGQAVEDSAPLAVLAASCFGSWADYGQAFLAGEAQADGSNFLGRKVLAGAVKRLQDDAASPWQTVPWPPRPEDSAAAGDDAAPPVGYPPA